MEGAHQQVHPDHSVPSQPIGYASPPRRPSQSWRCLPAVSVAARDGERVFRTYFINNRGDEVMGSTWSYLDATPLGRQETWEDLPEGYPQSPPYKWWNWHDNYAAEASPDPKWVEVSDAGEAAFRNLDAGAFRRAMSACGARERRTRVWCRERSDGRGGRPDRPQGSSRGRHVRASRTPRVRRRRGR